MNKKQCAIPILALIIGFGAIMPGIPLAEAQGPPDPGTTCEEILEKYLDAQVKAGKITEEEKEKIIEDTCGIIFVF